MAVVGILFARLFFWRDTHCSLVDVSIYVMVMAALVAFLDDDRQYFCFSRLSLCADGECQVAIVEQFLLAEPDIKSKDKVTDNIRRDEPWSCMYHSV